MIPQERILEKLDRLLQENDDSGAKRLLEYWLSEAESMRDGKGILLMKNELMGLCRKRGEREEALRYADGALEQIARMGLEENVGAATTYINAATVNKAFGLAERGLPLFEKAQRIYEAKLSPEDDRLGGLYNNMALALVDLKRFREAEAFYAKAIAVMERIPEKEPEQAITYLNLADAVKAEAKGSDEAERIEALVDRAAACLEKGKERKDGNYAFVCEKCASVFSYYGREDYASELMERCRRIYEGT